jgi:hypothetical protein
MPAHLLNLPEKPPLHAMIDIETLATPGDLPPGSLVEVTEIAIVLFDPRDHTEHHHYHAFPEPSNGQLTAGTVHWWMDHIAAGRTPQWFNARQDPDNALRPMVQILLNIAQLLRQTKTPNPIIWTKGAFDLPILADHYTAHRLPVPWAYHGARDLRTLLKVTNVHTPYQQTTHNALEDCRAQLRQLAFAMKIETLRTA